MEIIILYELWRTVILYRANACTETGKQSCIGENNHTLCDNHSLRWKQREYIWHWQSRTPCGKHLYCMRQGITLHGENNHTLWSKRSKVCWKLCTFIASLELAEETTTACLLPGWLGPCLFFRLFPSCCWSPPKFPWCTSAPGTIAAGHKLVWKHEKRNKKKKRKRVGGERNTMAKIIK